MSEWGRATFGDPCRECGFDWSTSVDEALSAVAAAPPAVAALVDGVDVDRRHPELTWSIKEYVCHVVDNLRISAERLMGAALGGSRVVGQYDQDDLAVARNYAAVPIEGALWSLQRAVDDWTAAIETAQRAAVVLDHPVRGDQTVRDVCLNNAHDVAHHRWDIERTLATGP